MLATIALKVLVQVLDAARIGRYDILSATAALAKQVTTRINNCDRQRRRLMSYLNQTRTHKIQDCLMAFFLRRGPRDKNDGTKTSGAFLTLVGSATYSPL